MRSSLASLILVILGCGSSVTVQNGQGGSAATGGSGGTPSGAGAFGTGGDCGGIEPPTLELAGRHFLLADLDLPVQTQLQFFAIVDTSEAPNAVVDLVNADRDNTAGCLTPCEGLEVCSSVLGACVPPSEKAQSLAEYVDFQPNSTPPSGYEAEARACVGRDGEAALLTTKPFTIDIASPPITVEDIVMELRYEAAPDGLVEATGMISIGEVYLGNTASGPGAGSLRGVQLPDF